MRNFMSTSSDNYESADITWVRAKPFTDKKLSLQALHKTDSHIRISIR